MKKFFKIERGSLDINGHKMSWELMRSEKPSAFGIYQSRIYELNVYRDGTLTADYNKKWLKVPYVDDEETPLCISHIVENYGKEKQRKEKSKNE